MWLRKDYKPLLNDILASDEAFRHIRPVHNKRAKRLSLRVDPKGNCIRLTIPPRAREISIERFLRQQIDWITMKYRTLPQKAALADGNSIPFRGTDCTLRYIHHNKRTTDIRLDNGSIVIATSRDDPSANLKRWMIAQARDFALPLADIKAGKIGKTVTRMDFRDTASRWGSCSSDGRIMLCWRLVMAPDYVFDYVIGHEVAHLEYMDHGKKFWDLCYALTDRPDEARAWLKSNGNRLLSFF